MARTATPVNLEVLYDCIRNCEKENGGAFRNFSKLFKAVAAAYNELENPQIAASLVSSRVMKAGELQEDNTLVIDGYKTLTSKGKRGRQPGVKGAGSGGRKGVEIDRALLVQVIKDLESTTEFKNRGSLNEAIAKEYNERSPEGAGKLNKMTVYNRLRQWGEEDGADFTIDGYTLKTSKGRAGRPSSQKSERGSQDAPRKAKAASSATSQDDALNEPQEAVAAPAAPSGVLQGYQILFLRTKAEQLGIDPEEFLQQKAKEHGLALPK